MNNTLTSIHRDVRVPLSSSSLTSCVCTVGASFSARPGAWFSPPLHFLVAVVCTHHVVDAALGRPPHDIDGADSGSPGRRAGAWVVVRK